MTSDCSCVSAIRRRKAGLGEEVTESICVAVAEPPPPLNRSSSRPPQPSQTLCPQHSRPSQTRAPVNTGSPCDYTRLGTSREENQAALLFQQVWITESILPPNLLLPLYSSRSAASLLSHTPGDSDFWPVMVFTEICYAETDGGRLERIRTNLSHTHKQTNSKKRTEC